MRRKSGIVVTALSVVAAVGIAVVAIAQDSDKGLSRAVEVDGPDIGPSGQTGELHYLENRGTEYQGDAEEFGPFRLLPPGVAFIPRMYQGEPTKSVEETTDPARWLGSPLALSAPRGFTEKAAEATIVNGDVIGQIQYAFESSEGVVHVATTSVQESQLPLDVYRYYEDSPLTIVTREADGAYIVVEQPKVGPTPNVGYVNVYDDGRLILLQSPDLGQDRLLDIGLALVKD